MTSSEEHLAQQLQQARELLAETAGQLRQARQEKKLLLKAACKLGYHVHAGAVLELRDCPVGFIFIEAGGKLVLDPGSPPGHVEERPANPA